MYILTGRNMGCYYFYSSLVSLVEDCLWCLCYCITVLLLGVILLVACMVADDLGSLLHDFSTPFFLSESERDVFATSQFWSFRGSLVTEKESILLIFDALWFVRFSCPYFLLSRPHNTVANIKITRESVRLNMSCMLVLLVGIYIVYTYFETSRLSYDFWDYY